MTFTDSRTRQAFLGDIDVQQAIVEIEDCSRIPEERLEAVAAIFNRRGFAVIQHGDYPDDPASQVLALGSLLGSTYAHNRADERGIVRMAPTDASGVYLGATNKEHPLHTDGAYDDTPPPLLALQCVVPASTGGLSTVLSGKALHDHLEEQDPEALAALYRSEALRVERADQKDTKAVFKNANGRRRLVWRSDYTATFAPDAETQRGVKLMKEFIADSANVVTFLLQRNQIILLDNLALLHGRTSFEAGDERKLNRVNFLADAHFATDRLVYGFTS